MIFGSYQGNWSHNLLYDVKYLLNLVLGWWLLDMVTELLGNANYESASHCDFVDFLIGSQFRQVVPEYNISWLP